MSNDEDLKIESATFQKLLEHLRSNPDVQNIDMMNLANFCRNCISKWYMAEAEKIGKKITYEDARELVYGMPYIKYKEKHQKEATQEQLEKFNERKSNK